jgi:hypothetical protein
MVASGFGRACWRCTYEKPEISCKAAAILIKWERAPLIRPITIKNGLFGTVYGFCLWGVIL